MKANQTVESRESRVENQLAAATLFPRPRPSTFGPRPAFTLIELLVVIAIMGVLAALIFPVLGGVKKRQYINHAQSEMAQLETALERYKAAYGFYPPGNQLNPANPLVNQLYYELTGTTNINPDPAQPPNYRSLNDPSLPVLTGGSGNQVETAFGVDGFMNCSKSVGGEDAVAARNFLPGLKPNQMGNYTSGGVTLLITSVGGPDAAYKPLDQQDLNPWRYVYPGTNNPGSYDLWVQLSIAKQTNLICNWTKQVQINSPLQ